MNGRTWKHCSVIVVCHDSRQMTEPRNIPKRLFRVLKLQNFEIFDLLRRVINDNSIVWIFLRILAIYLVLLYAIQFSVRLLSYFVFESLAGQTQQILFLRIYKTTHTEGHHTKYPRFSKKLEIGLKRNKTVQTKLHSWVES